MFMEGYFDAVKSLLPATHSRMGTTIKIQRVSVDQVCSFTAVIILLGHNVQDNKKIAGQPMNSAILPFTEES
jgi:hypothetical protein